VHTKDLFVHNGGHRQAVEAVGESLPELNVVTAFAFVVETIDTICACTLVISAEDEEVLGVLDLVREQETDHLERLFASVNIVPKEQVVGLRRESTVLEEAKQVIILTVDITTDLDRGLELEQDGLRHEDLASGRAQELDFVFTELDLLAGTGATD